MKDQGSGQFSLSTVGRLTGVASRMFASASTLRATRRILRQQLWLWPIIAAVLFGGAGAWVHQSVEHAMREQRATDLNAMVDASVTALKVWMSEQQISAELFADDE